MDDIRLVNEGNIAEQFVGQHLFFRRGIFEEPRLNYWLREGKADNAEVDYVIERGRKILPIEVKAGKAGSTYSTLTQALQSIIDGSIDISDEVGTSKIGKPHTGEDPTYVESPYSQKSIIDFNNNITSVKNAYMGGNEGECDESKSLHSYVKKIDSQLDNRIVEAIDNALVKINNMVAPFVHNYTDPSAGEAMEACQNLSDVLAEAKDAIKDN